MTKYDKLRINVRLKVEVGAHLGVPEEITIPVQSVRCNSEENAIPFCSVSVATGRDVVYPASFDGLSPIHVKGRLLRLPSRAQVDLKIKREDSKGTTVHDWPEDWFTVFEGWISNISPDVARGSNSVHLQLTHWLSDLDFSSPYSEAVHPTTPADFLFNAAITSGTREDRVVVGGTAVNKALAFLDSNSLAQDLWDNEGLSGLRPFLEAISSERLFNWQQIQRFVGSDQQPSKEKRTNELMQRALAKFEPIFDEDLGFSFYELGQQLKLRSDLIAYPQILQRFRSQFAMAAYSPSFLGGTMWEKLVAGWAAQFMFSIIPLADRALTVPYIPWNSRSWTIIQEDEFDSMPQTFQSRRPIRAVAVIGTFGTLTGMDAKKQPGAPQNSKRQVMGYYEPKASATNASLEGMTIYVEAPAWINDPILQGMSGQTARKDGKVPLAQNPKGPKLKEGEEPVAKTVEDKAKSAVALANALAKATYLQEATRWRQGVISTALRFDICPGSSIRIHSSPDKLVAALLESRGEDRAEGYIARVARVSWEIDISGSQPMAQTVFHLAYLRSFQENDDEAFADDEHPLWENTWTGAPLINLPEFRQ
jgi:hypothetical protein